MNDRIRPGCEWLDTEGKRIEAHGGTMYCEDGVYYWLGEDKSHTRKKACCGELAREENADSQKASRNSAENV